MATEPDKLELCRHVVVLRLEHEHDTDALGARLAAVVPAGTTVALEGALGAGKTRLVRAVAAACGVPAQDVTSPTFTLWQTYRGAKTIHHLDAYRLKDEDEFFALGVEEAFEDATAITFIEWADRVAVCLPDELLTVRIEVVGDVQREVRFSTTSPRLNPVLVDLTRPTEGT